MNKIISFGAMLTIAAGAMVFNSSCSSDNDMSNWKTPQQQEFSKQFTEQFGSIASNQNWGFSSVGVYTMPNSTKTVIKTDMPDYQNYEPAPAVTQDEITQVAAAFQNIPENYVSEQLDYTRFFVQQVYMSHRKYTANNGGEVDGSSKMNKLGVWTDDVTNDHANDFNVEAGSTVLFVNAGTKKFSYSNSTDGGKDYFDYIVKKVGNYYYVGFTFNANGQNPNEQVEGDNNYDDWIVRIVPAKMKGDEDEYTARIIVEDLGSIGDFDYNDAVFDAYIYNKDGATYANITLLAAGGTLPLYICGVDEQVEVHEKFGVSTGTMVNTKAGIDKSQVEFTLKIKNETSSTFNANDIAVKVNNSGNWTTLSANVGEAPEKICVDNSYNWCDEKVNIKTVYSRFTEYVANPSTKNWWKKNI